MKQVKAVYLAGLVQGLALVSFPAASAVFTSPHDFHLSSTGYGSLFIPQTITSIIASLISSKLSDKIGIKWVFLLGLIANLIAMLLFASSRLVMGHSTAFIALLFSTACLGIGFGLMVPTLNTLVAYFFPQKVERAVLILNALLGLGTALAPVFIALFVGFHIWWGLPLLLAGALLGLLLFSASLSFKQEKISIRKRSLELPFGFWIFAAFAFLYGMVETTNGNWATTYMRAQLHAEGTIASLALTFFWSMVTAGRIFFAAISRFFSEKMTFLSLPFVVAGAFLLFAYVPLKEGIEGALLFALAGLGCSALLPLTISFADKIFPSFTSSATGYIIAFYLLGYGCAAFGIGPLQDLAGLALPTIFGFASLIALALAGLSFTIVKMQN